MCNRNTAVVFGTGVDVTQCREYNPVCLVSICITSASGSDLMRGSLSHKFERIIIF